MQKIDEGAEGQGHMHAVWIIGGGRFGCSAAETLRRTRAGADILIVEKKPLRCRKIESMGLRTLCADGIDFLSARLESPAQRVWIVAAAPVHVAYEWARARASPGLRTDPLPMPAKFARLLPNAMPGGEGQLFASNADFICPPDCDETGRVCTLTGRRRPRNMHGFIRRIDAAGVKIIVVRSFQLAPGVGGFRPWDLFEALRQIESAPSAVVLATACGCHAVLNSFKIIS